MRFWYLIIFCLLFPAVIWAQGTISGRIIRSDTKNPVTGANVFLSNSSYGTSTANDGTFTLRDVRPGQYTLTIAHLGLAQYTQTVLVSNEPIKINVEMTPKAIQLREVTITTHADWLRNFEQFKKEFIGTDENAKYCEIKNPQILDFTYYKTQKVLLAAANEFLIVDNHALGYRVKFLIDTFRSDGISGIITYSGQKVFEELPGKAAEKKKWEINRDSSYYGSSMHFYRSLYKDRLWEEGFEMHRYIRYLNPERPPEDVIQMKYERFRLLGRADSANKYAQYDRMSKYFHETLYPEPSFVSQVLGRSSQPGIFAFAFPDCMYIVYTKKQDETFYRDIYRPLNMVNYQTTVLSFMTKERVCFFDMNGIVVGGSVLNEGTWSKSRLSQLLPVDYQPNPENSPAKSFMIKKQ